MVTLALTLPEDLPDALLLHLMDRGLSIDAYGNYQVKSYSCLGAHPSSCINCWVPSPHYQYLDKLQLRSALRLDAPVIHNVYAGVPGTGGACVVAGGETILDEVDQRVTAPPSALGGLSDGLHSHATREFQDKW